MSGSHIPTVIAFALALAATTARSAYGSDAGTKPVSVGSFVTCAADKDCASGHCVDGLCCDTPCVDKCHSCSLPSAPGICTLAPAGTDVRSECGAPGSCANTCDGSGNCVAASAGAVCSRAKCTSPTTGISQSSCSAAGASCDTSSAVPFDCTPYTCASPIGACLSSCRSSVECASGYTCDTASGRCIAPARATCSADGTSSIDTTGASRSCAPYRCTTDGLCSTVCATDADCVSGNRCDTTHGTCGAALPASGAGKSGGCLVGAPAGAPTSSAFGLGGAVLALTALVAAARRP